MPIASSSRALTAQAGAALLPGLEDYLEQARQEAASLTDADLDRRYPESTGVGLKETNPRLYASAARLFYQFGLSAREVAVACGISRNTVAAIIESERTSTESVVQRTARLRRVKAISTRALSVLEGMLADEAQCRKAGPAAIASIWRTLSDKADALEADLAKSIVEPVASNTTPPADAIAQYLGGAQ